MIFEGFREIPWGIPQSWGGLRRFCLPSMGFCVFGPRNGGLISRALQVLGCCWRAAWAALPGPAHLGDG